MRDCDWDFGEDVMVILAGMLVEGGVEGRGVEIWR